MKDRITSFIDSKGLTQAEFAEHINVQRSSVSHIISGRNKPGFQFINSILLAYPDLNARWLITGEGEPTVTNSEVNEENNNNLPISMEQIHQGSENRNVEKIIMFHSNGTFSEYKPQ